MCATVLVASGFEPCFTYSNY